MPSSFRGRPVLPGACRGEALVSQHGFNLLASFQAGIVARTKTASCSDPNNPDLYQKQLSGKILCLPQAIGPADGGLALQSAAELGQAPLAMLFAEHIDALAAAGVILTDVWQGRRIILVDQLGADFLQAVQTGQPVEVREDGVVVVG